MKGGARRDGVGARGSCVHHIGHRVGARERTEEDRRHRSFSSSALSRGAVIPRQSDGHSDGAGRLGRRWVVAVRAGKPL